MYKIKDMGGDCDCQKPMGDMSKAASVANETSKTTTDAQVTAVPKWNNTPSMSGPGSNKR